MSYLKKLFSTGAVRKTPGRIIKKIVDEVSFSGGATIVEVGAGQGEITRALVNRHQMPSINYYAYEIDAGFSIQLKNAYPQITVLNQNALDFAKQFPIPGTIDHFVSSIPLSFYKRKEIEDFCNSICNHLKGDGKFTVLFTAFWLIPVLKKQLPHIIITPFFTFPPYFIGVYTKPSGTSKG